MPLMSLIIADKFQFGSKDTTVKANVAGTITSNLSGLAILPHPTPLLAMPPICYARIQNSHQKFHVLAHA